MGVSALTLYLGIHPTDYDVTRRIIGLPGETIEVRDSRVVLNGQLLAYEPVDPRTSGATDPRKKIGTTLTRQSARTVAYLTVNSENLQWLPHASCGQNSEGEERIVRVLVIEDEPKVARALKQGLEGEHYEVTVANTGEEGFFHVSAEVFDLVVLDLMLPGRDGLEILSTMRQRAIQTPVLILTARDTIEDRVIGLDSGADDYLVKPFAFPELVARIRALLRRGRTDSVLRLKTADLEMDLVARTVTREGEKLELTPREFELLEYLMRHHRQVVSREMLARDVWKETARATPLDNVIDVHVARLRKKVDQRNQVKLIHTVRGVGFVLREDSA